MATISGNLYKVRFQVVKLNPNNQAGPNNAYRKAIQEAFVVANSPHAVAAVLNNNGAVVGSGEVLEIFESEHVLYGDGNIYT